MHLELLQVVDHLGAEELASILQCRLVNDNWVALGLDPLHNAPDDGGTEIVRVAFHSQPVHAYRIRITAYNPVSNEILLEKHHIGEKISQDVTDCLEKAKLIMYDGTIVDATIIAAPSSTRKKKGTSAPEMHQTKKATSSITA